MEKKKQYIVIGVGAAAIALMLLVLVVIAVWIGAMKNLMIEDSVVSAPQTISYDSSYGGEPPTIFADSSVEFKGADTVSAEDGTIQCGISVTPAEFREGTKAKVKIDGKTYPLKRKDNTFVGTIPVSAFKSVDPEVILEDGETVRTESIEGESPYLPIDFSWLASGPDPHVKKDKIDFDMEIHFGFDELSSEAPNTARIVGIADGKQVYEKEMEVSGLDGDSPKVDWKGSIKVPEKTAVDIYILSKDDKGFVYRYKLGTAGAKRDFFSEQQHTLEVLSPDGKLLLKKEMTEE
ncbi:hypothetical protein NE619_03310 [Anaerovorax odorimutans]|uniref:Uncharacterized protein n=1 Tax=Anaerovorax odorimutans TaxID=109327 RepID=A0ABT1RKN9_9FIRM|nr:hypothetical protein [Anaerovorax odorimutans]MCQ4635744.1 hypothetical protein [Anaerovorax odorimutans]